MLRVLFSLRIPVGNRNLKVSLGASVAAHVAALAAFALYVLL